MPAHTAGSAAHCNGHCDKKNGKETKQEMVRACECETRSWLSLSLSTSLSTSLDLSQPLSLSLSLSRPLFHRVCLQDEGVYTIEPLSCFQYDAHILLLSNNKFALQSTRVFLCGVCLALINAPLPSPNTATPAGSSAIRLSTTRRSHTLLSSQHR